MLDHTAARSGSSARAPASRGTSEAIATTALAGTEIKGVQRNTPKAAKAIPADAKRRAGWMPCRTGHVFLCARRSSSTSGSAVRTLLHTPSSIAGAMTHPGASAPWACM